MHNCRLCKRRKCLMYTVYNYICPLLNCSLWKFTRKLKMCSMSFINYKRYIMFMKICCYILMSETLPSYVGEVITTALISLPILSFFPQYPLFLLNLSPCSIHIYHHIVDKHNSHPVHLG